MTKTRFLFVTILLFLLISCSVTKLQKAGIVSTENFHQKIEFSLHKSIILIPVTINSKPNDFLFDTGAQLTAIQSDSLFGKIKTVTGASGKELKMGLDKVKSIKIGNVEFVNTYALNQSLAELKEKIPNFGGLIGQSVIQKANWLIDYPNKKMEISNNDLSDSTFTAVEIERKDGSPFTFISINGKKYKAIIDLGASGSLSIPKNSKLAEDLIKTYHFEDIEKANYTVGGGFQKTKQKIGKVPIVKLNSIENKNIETYIKNTTNIRIGSGFFKGFLVYIDNTNGNYKIKKVN